MTCRFAATDGRLQHAGAPRKNEAIAALIVSATGRGAQHHRRLPHRRAETVFEPLYAAPRCGNLALYAA
jgi:hypothetical protein